MSDYDELVKALRGCVLSKPCDGCPYYDQNGPTKKCATMNIAAANAIDELLAIQDEDRHNYDLANEDIERLEAQIPRWIPVSEKLPDVPGTYLVLVREPKKFTERRIKGEVEEWENFDFSHVEPVFYNNDQCIWDDDDIPMNANLDVVNTYEAFHVTHWMPLPPPEEE